MHPLRQSPSPHGPLPRRQRRALLGLAAVLAVVLLWFYVDLLHEQVRNGESVRERIRASAPLFGDAGPIRLVDGKGWVQLRLGPGTAEASTGKAPR